MASTKEKISQFIGSIFDRNPEDEFRSPLAGTDVSPQRSDFTFGQNIARGPIGQFGVKAQNFLESPTSRIKLPTLGDNVNPFLRTLGNLGLRGAEGILTEPIKTAGDIGRFAAGGAQGFQPASKSVKFGMDASLFDRRFDGPSPFETVQAPTRGKINIGPVNLPEFGLSESPIAQLGKTGLQAFEAPLTAFGASKRALVAFNLLISGAADQVTGGSFEEGVQKGTETALPQAGFLGVTSPLIDKIGGPLLARLASKSGANVVEGIALDRVIDSETTGLSLAIDAVVPVGIEVSGAAFKPILEKFEKFKNIPDKFGKKPSEIFNLLKNSKTVKNLGNKVSEITTKAGNKIFYDFKINRIVSGKKAALEVNDLGPKESRFITNAEGQDRVLLPDGTYKEWENGVQETFKATPEQLKNSAILGMGFDVEFDDEGNFIGFEPNQSRMIFAASVLGVKNKDQIIKKLGGLDGERIFKKNLSESENYSDYLRVNNEGFFGTMGKKASVPTQLLNRFARGGISAFKTMGKGGEALIKGFKEAEFFGETMNGKAWNAMSKALKRLSPEDNKNFHAVAQGLQQPESKEMANALRVWDQIRTDISNQSIQSGLKIEGRPWQPIPNYFPKKLPADVLKGGKDRFLKKIIESGQAKSMAEAEAVLTQYIRNKPVQRFGNLEKSRTFDMPDYDRDPNRVLEQYIRGAYGRLGDAIHLGPNNELIENAVKTIESEGKDANSAKFITDTILGKNVSSDLATEISNAATALQVVTKMGLSTFTNATQPVMTAMFTNPMAVLKAIGNFVTDKEGSKEFAQRAGIIADNSAKHIDNIIGEGASGSSWRMIAEKFLDVTKFSAVEMFNRVTASTAGRDEAERFARQLLADPTNNRLFRELERLDLDPSKILKQGGLSEDDAFKAGRKVVEETQFLTDTLRIPAGLKNPAGRILSQFKSFGFLATKAHTKNVKHISKEMFKGNPRPLINSLFVLGVAAPIAGEVAKDIKAFIKNKKRTEKGLERYVSNVLAGGGFGLAGDLGGLFGKFGSAGIVSTLAGPTAGDIFKGFEVIGSLTTDRKTLEGADEFKARTKPLLRESVKKIPIIGHTLANTFISNSFVEPFVGPNSEKSKAIDKYRQEVLVDTAELPSDLRDVATLYDAAFDKESSYHDARLKIEFDSTLTDEQRSKKIKTLEEKTYAAIKMKIRIGRENPEAVIGMELDRVSRISSATRRVDWVRDTLSKLPENERGRMLVELVQFESASGKKIITKSVAEQLGILSLYNANKPGKKPAIKSAPAFKGRVSKPSKIKTIDFEPLKIASLIPKTQEEVGIDIDLESLRNPNINI